MEDRPPARAREAFILLVAPVIWGVGFVATRWTLSGSGPLWSNALRFAAAALLLLPFVAGRLRGLDRRRVGHGLALGLLLFLAFTFQTVGLVTTTVSRSSFITGLYAVFTPLLGIAFGRRARPGHLAAVAIALAGLWLLARPQVGADALLGRGDLLTLGCAIATALQILVTDRVAGETDPLVLNFLQIGALAAASLAAALAFEGRPAILWSWKLVEAQAYLVVLSSLVAFTIQLHAQRRLPPTAAAMIFLLEAPFGALAGRFIEGDRLSTLQLGGCALLLAASALAVSVREAPRGSLPRLAADGG